MERQNGPESEGMRIAFTSSIWPEKAFRFFRLKISKCYLKYLTVIVLEVKYQAAATNK